MSGEGRHTVFKDMEIGAWPNGLTLDHLEKRIVWTDARYTIRAFQAVCRSIIKLSIQVWHYMMEDSPMPD